MNNKLQNLINIVKNGSSIDVKSAQKQIEKIWHETCRQEDEERELVFGVFLEELKSFSQIKDVDHQAFFINILKWPLYFLGSKYFFEWANFMLEQIQNESGKIRQAVIKASDYLMIDLKLDTERYNFLVKSKKLDKIAIENMVNFDKKSFAILL